MTLFPSHTCPRMCSFCKRSECTKGKNHVSKHACLGCSHR